MMGIKDKANTRYMYVINEFAKYLLLVVTVVRDNYVYNKCYIDVGAYNIMRWSYMKIEETAGNAKVL